MITIIISAIKIIFLLGFLIGIHETGHFLIAKLCKVKVNEFAIGFGPTILKHQGRDTKYALRLFPLGGFVNMEGEEEPSEEEGSFSKASIPKRIAIVLAGATVNIIFAIIVYFVLSANAGNNISTVVDYCMEDYAAIQNGIESNDEIIKINGKRVRTQVDVSKIINEAKLKEVEIIIKRENKKHSITLIPTEVKYNSTGIYLYELNQKSTKVAGLVDGGAAKEQGLQAGDEIILVNGEHVKNNPERLIEILNDNKYSNYEIVINRHGKSETINIIPKEESAYYLGVVFKKAENSFRNNTYYAIFDTKDFLKTIFENVIKLFSGKISTEQLMGPVGISEVVAKTNGLRDFIYTLALISISLGVTNLIPFPPLDGGKVLTLIIEWIRRKPIKQETELKIQLFGFAVLITLSLYVTYNDILRIF